MSRILDRRYRWFLIGTFLTIGALIVLHGQTPAFNAMVTLDSNGYLNVSASGAGTGQGPAAPMGNTLVKTDSSNYLLVNCQSGCAGAGVLPSNVQGDIFYGSGVNTVVTLAKSASATRYLSNTGTSNNPAWAQVALANGISGFGTGIATALAVNTGSAGAPVLFNGALGTPTSGTLTNATGLPEAGLSFTDITTANATTSQHGLLIKGDANAGHCLSGSITWVTCGSGGASVPGYLVKTTDYTLVASTDFPTIGTVQLTTNIGTFTLPTAVGIAGQVACLINHQTANALTIHTTPSSQTIDGLTPAAYGTIANGGVCLQSDNANWQTVWSAGLPIGALTSGGVLYASSTTQVASSALLTQHAIVLGGGAGAGPYPLGSLGTTTTVLHGSASGDPSFSGISVSDFANIANNTILSNVSGGSSGPSANTSIPLNTPLIYVSAVTQSGTCSIAFSTAASGGPVCSATDGTNQHYGTVDWTATGKPVYGAVPILETLTSAVVTESVQFYCDSSCSGGNIGWTFSYRRVPDAGTMDQTFTGCTEISAATPTSGQKKTITGTCSVTSLAKGDLLQWKLDQTTGAATFGTTHLLNFTVMPVASKPIGGG